MSIRILIAGLVAAAPVASLGHHSSPLYDMKKNVTLEGPLTEVKWAYPHPTAKVIWKKKAWKMVLPPVTVLAARGFTKEMLETAKSVTIVANPRKDGTAEMRVATMIADGKKL